MEIDDIQYAVTNCDRIAQSSEQIQSAFCIF